ncbi:MAG: FG-GAP-like repeat-containing protein [bacterium]
MGIIGRRGSFAGLILVLLAAAGSLEAASRELVLTRGRSRPIPGEQQQAAAFVRNYTRLQSGTRPFDRFRFQPSAAARARIERLRAGGSDTVKVLCLRVEFAEDTTPLTTGNGKMDTLGFLHPDSGLFYDPPHFKRYFERQMEGLANYYRAQSNGRLVIEPTVMPEGEKDSYQLPRQMQYYGDTTSWLAVEIGLVRLARDLLKIADEDPAFRFGDYDEFIIFHAGSGLQADFGLRRDSPFDLLAGHIPYGAFEAYLGESYIRVDGGATRIYQVTVMPEMMRQDTMWNDQVNILGMVGLAGTLVHEFAHILGAYDLYDVTGVTMGQGAWSLMGYGGWLGDYGAGAPPGVIPGFLDAYHRVALGLVNPVVVQTPVDSIPVFAAAMDTALFALRPDSTHPTIIKVPINADEYFLIENRQVDVRRPDTIIVKVEDGVLVSIEDNEYDFFLPGSGILIWHVDESVIADYGPYNAINIFPEHKGVDLREADGVQDFDVPWWDSWAPDYEIYGSPWDPFFKGGYNDEFGVETRPGSDGHTGKSFIRVKLLGETDTTRSLKDTIIPVRIGWDLQQPGFPVSNGSAPFRSAFAVDLDLDGFLEVVALDTTGRISAWRHDGSSYLPGRNGLFAQLGTSSQSDVAIGDVTGDGRPEVVAGGTNGTVRVFRNDGTGLGTLRTDDRVLAAPVLADLTGDGRREIIVGSTDMRLYAWNADLELLPGFPVALGAEVRAAVAVTDTVSPQVVCLTADGRLFLLNKDGTVADGFPVVLSNAPFYNTAQPVVCDFDRDGRREIAVVAADEYDNRLFIVSLDGEVRFRSAELVRQTFAGLPAVGDVTGDGYPNIMLASMNELFGFNRNATLAGNYPFRQDSTYLTSELVGNWIIYYDTYFQYRSSPVIADVSGDGRPDLVIGSPRYGLLGFDSRTGDTVRFFPLMTTAPVSAVPLVADLDGDGDIELIAGTEDGIMHVWDLPGPASGIVWACAYHDPAHTGLVLESELGPMPGPADEAVGSFFVYPNPAGRKATIRYRLGVGVEAVRLRLFDMAGEPSGPGLVGPAVAGTDNEVELRLHPDYAPGLYIVKLEAETETGTLTRFARLAVVR